MEVTTLLCAGREILEGIFTVGPDLSKQPHQKVVISFKFLKSN